MKPPSWYLVGSQDAILPPALERTMATRAHSRITETPASHLSPLSQPAAVVEAATSSEGELVDLQLSGKTALVTGASRGIGLAIARGLAAEGARVVAGARTISAELRALAEQASVVPVAVDLATPDGPAELVEAAHTAIGPLDILVNNVGAVRPRTGGSPP